MFPLKSERSSSGLVEFPSVALAVQAIMKCNHTAIDHKGNGSLPAQSGFPLCDQNAHLSNTHLCDLLGTKFPFIMKLCFSSSKTMNGAWNNENIENMKQAGSVVQTSPGAEDEPMQAR